MLKNEIMVNIDKDKIRAELKKKYSSNKAVWKDSANFAICEVIADLSEVKNGKIIALYSAMDYEVDLGRFAAEAFKRKQRLCFPRAIKNAADTPEYEMAEIVDLSELKTGRYAIPEPGSKCRICTKEKIDVWLVPGVAFAPDGIRLGRGGGVYDRLLKDAVGKKIGVLYQAQLLEYLPCEQHDIKMDMLVTEKGVSAISTK